MIGKACPACEREIADCEQEIALALQDIDEAERSGDFKRAGILKFPLPYLRARLAKLQAQRASQDNKEG
jgi:hypothetical protein